jgi:hypothetical protein
VGAAAVGHPDFGGGLVRLHLTDHAVEQYVARVKPALATHQAKAELLALVELAGNSPTTEPPPWIQPDSEHFGAYYLIVSDGVCLAIKPNGFVATCLVRGERSPEQRARRKAEKQKLRTKKRWTNNRGEQGRHERNRRPAWG